MALLRTAYSRRRAWTLNVRIEMMKRERTHIIVLLFTICGAYLAVFFRPAPQIVVPLACAVALAAAIALLKVGPLLTDKLFAFAAALPAGAILLLWMKSIVLGD